MAVKKTGAKKSVKKATKKAAKKTGATVAKKVTKKVTKKSVKKSAKKVAKKTVNKTLANVNVEFIKGGVTAAAGFSAGGIRAGIKIARKNDLAIILSDRPAHAAGIFTQNTLRAPSVERAAALLPTKYAQAIICASGCANACTGAQGAKDDAKIARGLAQILNVPHSAVITASTGVIGQLLPTEKIINTIPKLVEHLSNTPAGGTEFAQTILTTDLAKKESAVRVKIGKKSYTIGAAAKGSGMIHPNMATMLVFITTDASIDRTLIALALKRVADRTFNCLSVDGDTSTNDMVTLLANGASGTVVGQVSGDFKIFEDALYMVCDDLCKQIAADGEGATKRVEVRVTGARTDADAQRAAKSVASSNLVKCAIFGCDPNWGRIACAIGNSGASMSRNNLSIAICGVKVFEALQPAKFDEKKLNAAMSKKKVITIDVSLGKMGEKYAVAHTCDMSYDYIKINAAYRT